MDGLFERLPAGNHELVLFDLNRVADVEHLLKQDPRESVERLFARTDLTFAITLITNENEASRQVVAHRRPEGGEPVKVSPLGMAWPDVMYSLAHIALPFPPDDPVYGGADAKKSPGVQIGNLVLRGENGVLQISAADLLRVHWNPFYGYLEHRMLEFMSLSAEAGTATKDPANAFGETTETEGTESQP